MLASAMHPSHQALTPLGLGSGWLCARVALLLRQGPVPGTPRMWCLGYEVVKEFHFIHPDPM
jgi:hypothetical protein